MLPNLLTVRAEQESEGLVRIKAYGLHDGQADAPKLADAAHADGRDVLELRHVDRERHDRL